MTALEIPDPIRRRTGTERDPAGAGGTVTEQCSSLGQRVGATTEPNSATIVPFGLTMPLPVIVTVSPAMPTFGWTEEMAAVVPCDDPSTVLRGALGRFEASGEPVVLRSAPNQPGCTRSATSVPSDPTQRANNTTTASRRARGGLCRRGRFGCSKEAGRSTAAVDFRTGTSAVMASCRASSVSCDSVCGIATVRRSVLCSSINSLKVSPRSPLSFKSAERGIFTRSNAVKLARTQECSTNPYPAVRASGRSGLPVVQEPFPQLSKELGAPWRAGEEYF
jgi:hypothetical protein